MNANEKLVALLLNEDFIDKSVSHLILAADANLNKIKEEYYIWYDKVHDPDEMEYMSFRDWLLKHGAREASEIAIEIISY